MAVALLLLGLFANKNEGRIGLMKFDDMPYQRVNYAQTKEKCLKIIAEIKSAKSPEAALGFISEYNKLQDHVSTAYTITYIRHTVNTNDKFYADEMKYYDEYMPKLQEMSISYFRTILNSPHRAELEKELGRVYFKNAEITVQTFDKKIMEDMVLENQLVTEYCDFIASAQIDFDGGKKTLAQLGSYRNSADRNMRRKANEAYFGFFEENAEKFDDLYDKLVKVRDAQAKKLGYKDFTELGYLRMNRNCYGKSEVSVFRKTVQEKVVPLTRMISKRQCAMLGINEMMYYDDGIFYKEGNPKPVGTPSEIFDAGLKMYRELSPETGEFFDFMLKNGLFDALAKKGKAGGGYCTEISEYKSPFIFANFNGTFDDINTLTHEAGHAFQSYLARDNYPPENRIGTMETAEIDSMSMEFFTWPWMELFFGEDADRYRFMHLAGALKFIPYGCAVDEFQHIVYENPGLSPKERNRAWRELEKIYQPDLNYGENKFLDNGGRWQRQSHIYERPFYYIDYCLAQTCALEFWMLMMKDRKLAWEKYLKLCKLGGKDTFTGLLAQIDMNSPFATGCLESVVTAAEKYLSDFDVKKLRL